MIFERNLKKTYRQSIEDAFATILDKGDDQHKLLIKSLMGADMLVRVGPVAHTNASGRTGLISPVATNARLMTERLNTREALGEIYIFIAEETIDTGGQRGCEGTFVHEGQHAWDFAEAISSYSNRDYNPIGVTDPSLFDLELAAHQTAGRYMLRIGRDDYLQEGIDLMILGRSADGTYFLNDAGIRQRLDESYGLQEDGNIGPTAFQLMGIIV